MPKITQLNNINTNRVLTNDFRSRNIKNLSNRLTLDNIIVRNLSTYQKKPNIIRKSRFYDKNSRDTFSQLLFILQNGMDLTIRKGLETGTVYNYNVLKTHNVFAQMTKTLTNIGGKFPATFTITQTAFDNDDSVVISFTILLKYEGLFEKCVNALNTTVNGVLTITKDSSGDYAVTDHSIYQVDYERNDFCKDIFSAYYSYDVPDDKNLNVGVDTEDQSELEIYRAVKSMLDNMIIVKSGDTITITSQLDDINGKITIPTVTTSYKNKTPVSPLRFLFDPLYNVIVTHQTQNGMSTLPVQNNILPILGLVTGDSIILDVIGFKTIRIIITTISA